MPITPTPRFVISNAMFLCGFWAVQIQQFAVFQVSAGDFENVVESVTVHILKDLKTVFAFSFEGQ